MILPHELFPHFLHNEIIIFDLHVQFSEGCFKMSYLFSQFFIFAEKVVGLRLEVIELIAKLPYFILSVFLSDCLVELFHYLFGLRSHLLDLSLH